MMRTKLYLAVATGVIDGKLYAVGDYRKNKLECFKGVKQILDTVEYFDPFILKWIISIMWKTYELSDILNIYFCNESFIDKTPETQIDWVLIA